MSGTHPATYDYLLSKASSAHNAPAILDYGCGQGPLVKYGLARGFDIVGCDPFEGHYGVWLNSRSEMPEHLKKMDDGKIPFADARFDVVISNQVFEHVTDCKPCFEEIFRVLKPGGSFFALFPIKETFYEGHAQLYFVHYLNRYPKAQYRYLAACRRLGFGKDEWPDATPAQWAKRMQQVVRDVCFYHPYRQIRDDVESVFGSSVERLGAEYLAFRGRRLKLDRLRSGLAGNIVDPIFASVALRRSGLAMSIRKPG